MENGEAELPSYATKFSQDEIAAEDRKPKRKVAVMIGYAGTGYKGMQLTQNEKTIEGDLFSAFVAAGAISKANADDPKKSSLVRCARTDKGVHAAGNVVSLKLVVEEPDIVKKINEHLPEQIRIWGFVRTVNSFSCYQQCDSRIYEYLIPSHCFLPPHPSTYLGKRLDAGAKEADDEEGYSMRQEEVSSFWSEVEEKRIKPILEGLDEKTRSLVRKSLYEPDAEAGSLSEDFGNPEGHINPPVETAEELHDSSAESNPSSGSEKSEKDNGETSQKPSQEQTDEQTRLPLQERNPQLFALQEAIKSLKAVYQSARRSYRIHPKRLERVRAALALYNGTKNFHNYTVQKIFRDPSAKRLIKSFVVDEPKIINGTEWLSLKVHGQSFMMHQIRKMVGMVALCVRSGTDFEKRMDESFGPTKFSIPKAPGLGLLLERPIFNSYNDKAKNDHGREAVEFQPYNEEIEKFKQKEIYDRIFRVEQELNTFHGFFNHIDNFGTDLFLWLTSKGTAALKEKGKASGKRPEKDMKDLEGESDTDENIDVAGGAEG